MSAGHTPGVPDEWLHDGEWARVGPFFIYPREPDFYIGTRTGPDEFSDCPEGIAFTNINAAIDHARWMVDERRAAIAKATGQEGGAA